MQVQSLSLVSLSVLPQLRKTHQDNRSLLFFIRNEATWITTLPPPKRNIIYLQFFHFQSLSIILNQITFSFLGNDLLLTLTSLLLLKDIIRSVYVRRNKTNSPVLNDREVGETKQKSLRAAGKNY